MIEPSVEGKLLFSQRERLAICAVNWCREYNAAIVPENIVTALYSLGLIDIEKSKILLTHGDDYIPIATGEK